MPTATTSRLVPAVAADYVGQLPMPGVEVACERMKCDLAADFALKVKGETTLLCRGHCEAAQDRLAALGIDHSRTPLAGRGRRR